MPVALQKQIELMVFGALIILFLIVEPHGLARLWQIGKEKLRLWPFPSLRVFHPDECNEECP